MADDVHVSIEDFFPKFLDVQQGESPLPHMPQALNVIGEQILVQWRKYTQGESMPGTPRVINSRGPYTKSIHLNDESNGSKVIESTGPWTDWIEKGHGEIDLKPGLLSGPKARMGKKGPYTIVSFRQGVPTSIKSNNPMPQDTYKHMINMTGAINKAYQSGQSAQPGTSRVTSNTGGKRKTTWGYRLPAEQGGEPQAKTIKESGFGKQITFNGETFRLAGRTPGEYTHKTGKQTGMVRMDTSAGRGKTSEYRTFRVVSMRSDPRSWIVPAADPLPIRDKVIQAVAPKAQDIIRAMLEEDLK
jgi:hypothetical protein